MKPIKKVLKKFRDLPERTQLKDKRVKKTKKVIFIKIIKLYQNFLF